MYIWQWTKYEPSDRVRYQGSVSPQGHSSPPLCREGSTCHTDTVHWMSPYLRCSALSGTQYTAPLLHHRVNHTMWPPRIVPITHVQYNNKENSPSNLECIVTMKFWCKGSNSFAFSTNTLQVNAKWLSRSNLGIHECSTELTLLRPMDYILIRQPRYSWVRHWINTSSTHGLYINKAT